MATELSVSKIEQRIYFIRERQVMLDSDLAHLYEVKTKVLNQAARRNQKRFPGEDFMFQLLENEYHSLRSQFVTLENGKSSLKSVSSCLEDSLRSQFVTLENGKKGNHRKFLPTVYTEYGAVMLSGILSSDRAIEVNVAVVKAFVEFRKKFNIRPALERRMEQLERWVDQIDQKYDQRSQTILQAIQQLRPLIVSASPALSQLPGSSSIDSQIRKKKSEVLIFGKRTNSIVKNIQKGVAQYYCIKIQDLNTPTRQRTISLPRQIAIFLIRKHTQLSFKDIGKIFGGKDHTTAMHAYQKIKTSILINETIREGVAAIEGYLLDGSILLPQNSTTNGLEG